MTALPPCNTCGGAEYHWARYTHARFVAGAFPIFEDFSMDEAHSFYESHAADLRWTPDEFDRNAMRHLGVRVPDVDGPGPGSTPDSRRVAGQTHDYHPGQPCCAPLLNYVRCECGGNRSDGHRCEASIQATTAEAQKSVAPLLNVGDRVRVGPAPFYVSLGRQHTTPRAAAIAGAECRVDEGPDREGDYRILTDSLAPAWVHGSCLTKIEEAEA